MVDLTLHCQLVAIAAMLHASLARATVAVQQAIPISTEPVLHAMLAQSLAEGVRDAETFEARD